MPHTTFRDREPLGHLFPRPYEVPKHATRYVRAQPEHGAVLPRRFDPVTGDTTDQPRAMRISPWRGGRGPVWWRLHRAATWTYGPETQEAQIALVYLNGGGSDPELRFVVHDITRRPDFTVHPPNTQYGASNDFMRISAGLRNALAAIPEERSPLWGLGARGLFDPRKADVLTVIRWVDTLLANLYGWPHDPNAPGGANDVFDVCRRTG